MKMQSNYQFILTNQERNHLYHGLSNIEYDPSGGADYIHEIKTAALSTLPHYITRVLHQQKASIQPAPYLVFENLPTDDTIYTSPNPRVFTPSAKSGYISENILMAFAAVIGEPYSISFEGAEIVNNLIPVPAHKNDFTGLGSKVELDFHIENAALKFMNNVNYSPLGLLLSGVRHDPNGPLTRIADARAALRLLSAEEVDVLRQPLFEINIPYRWRAAFSKENTRTKPVPLVQGDIDMPEVSAVFYSDMLRSLSPEAAIIVYKFHQAIKQVSFGIDIQPGKLLYIDNRFALHSRDAFSPTLDEQGLPLRWVQRVFVAPNLWHHRNLKSIKNRIFEPICLN